MNMDSIPDEILQLILQQGSSEELFKWRRVSRRFSRVCAMTFCRFMPPDVLRALLKFREKTERSRGGFCQKWIRRKIFNVEEAPLLPIDIVEQTVRGFEQMLASNNTLAIGARRLRLRTVDPAFPEVPGVNWAEVGAAALRSLTSSNWRRLTKMQLGGILLDVPGLRALENFIKGGVAQQLKVLDFGYSLDWAKIPERMQSEHEESGTGCLKALLRACTRLETLIIQRSLLKADILNVTSVTLKELRFHSFPKIPSEDHSDLTEFWQQDRNKLRIARLILPSITPRSFPSPLPRNSLRSLSLGSNVPMRVHEFDPLTSIPNLESLYLHGKKKRLTIEILRNLLENCSKLRRLSFYSTNIGNEFLDEIGPYNNITTLFLSDCPNVSLAGVANLLALRGETSKTLTIYCTDSAIVNFFNVLHQMVKKNSIWAKLQSNLTMRL